MCGITGIYNFKTNSPVDRKALSEMTGIIAHRGPDADGLHFDGPVGLGHRRLAILDLSERGRQPMFYQDGRYVIVFNGEIYNYIELRQEVVSKGYRFRTDTDTEVLMALFADRGSACLDRLNGMFAFAIWDTVEHTLFIARDRAGIKPLYYSVTRDGIVFASEVKALLASEQVTADVALPLVDTYFTFGYIPGEDTLFQGCKKLPPGHWMLIRPDGIRMESYWDLEYAPNTRRTARETADELHDLLLDATRIHLRSDVPVGVFLSGGLDSSATVSLLSEAGFRNLKTFAIAYKEDSFYDESEYARIVARRFDTDHHVLYMNPGRFQDFIPDYVWYMDEPVTEAPALSLYFIAKELRQHVTVALSGEGADELFAGYDIYRYMQWIETYRNALPEFLRHHVIEPLAGLVPNEKLKKYARLARLPLEERYLGVSLHDPWYKNLYTDQFRSALAKPHTSFASYYEKTGDWDVLSRMLYADLKTWLVDDLLVKADKMTMANAVELRVPFLDYRVIEFAATVPSEMKSRGGDVKWILKEAMRGRLPQEILSRKKRGFPTPLAQMFQGDLSSYLHDLLLSERCVSRAYFRRDGVERLISEHVSKRADHHQILWKLVVLEEWHRKFIDTSVSRDYVMGIA